MIVSDIMTREIVSVTPDTRLEDAARLMADRKLSGLPVVAENGMVVGMITEGDLLRRAEIGTEGKSPGRFELFFLPGASAYDYVRTHANNIRMLMSSDIVSVAPGAPLAAAAKLMQTHNIKRLPVVDDGHLVGILARADLVRVLADALKPCAPRTDDAIREKLAAELAKQGWIPRAQIEATVDNGIVEFRGTISDPRQRDALHALADSIGANGVKDGLVCIEPISGAMLD